MAFSAHSDPEMVKERYDPEKTLDDKLDNLAKLVRASKHLVIFTGAGISTDAGIPDFRGPEGVWTLKAQGKARTSKTTDTLCAIPTTTHMSIVALQRAGICKYLISQNCDGLHRRSGILPHQISELHGNGNIEHCEDCKFEYLRDYPCYRISRGSDHYTGRHCVVPTPGGGFCNGRLLDSTIDFGQNLPEKPLDLAYENSVKSDLHLVLGSSLTVSPACDMPRKTARGKGKLVICNLQNTPLEGDCSLHLFARCDVVMKGLLKRLSLPIPPFTLNRTVSFGVTHDGDKVKVLVKGVERGTKGQPIPASILKTTEMVLGQIDESGEAKERKVGFVVKGDPAAFTVKKSVLSQMSACFRLNFMGNYHEPFLDVKVNFEKESTLYMWMSYNPKEGEGWSWNVRSIMSSSAISSESDSCLILRHFQNELECLQGAQKNGETVEKKGEGVVTRVDPKEVVCGDGEECYPAAAYTSLFGTAVPVFCPLPSPSPSPSPCPSPLAHTTFAHLPMSGNIFGFEPTCVSQFAKGAWTTEQANLPITSEGTAIVYPRDHSQSVFLFGGMDQKTGTLTNNMYRYDPTDQRFLLVNPKGDHRPCARMGHSCTVVTDHLMVVFGGICKSGDDDKFLNDLHVYDKGKMTWRELKFPGKLPSPRAQHSAFMVDHRTLCIIGGYDGEKFLSDAILLDLVDRQWRDDVPPPSPPPSLAPSLPFSGPLPERERVCAFVSKPMVRDDAGEESKHNGPQIVMIQKKKGNKSGGVWSLSMREWEWIALGDGCEFDQCVGDGESRVSLIDGSGITQMEYQIQMKR